MSVATRHSCLQFTHSPTPHSSHSSLSPKSGDTQRLRFPFVVLFRPQFVAARFFDVVDASPVTSRGELHLLFTPFPFPPAQSMRHRVYFQLSTSPTNTHFRRHHHHHTCPHLSPSSSPSHGTHSSFTASLHPFRTPTSKFTLLRKSHTDFIKAEASACMPMKSTASDRDLPTPKIAPTPPPPHTHHCPRRTHSLTLFRVTCTCGNTRHTSSPSRLRFLPEMAGSTLSLTIQIVKASMFVSDDVTPPPFSPL